MTASPLTRDTMIGPFPLPQIDDELRANARDKPGEWISFLDPAVKPGVSDPPKYAVQGGYYADENGQIADYRINPGYAPSKVRAGFGLANGFELTLWRALHGYNPLGLLADSFYHAELLGYAEHEGDSRLPVVSDPEKPELSLFPICTSPQFSGWEYTRPIVGGEIFKFMASTDVVLDINPGTNFGLRMSARALAGLINSNTPYLKAGRT